MGSGSRTDTAAFALGFLLVTIVSLPVPADAHRAVRARAALLHPQRATFDPIVAVARPALYLEACIAREQAEVDRVRTRGEVRLELELVVVDHEVARQPQSHRVLAVGGLVIAVVAPVVPNNVDEGLPLRRHRRKD